MTVSLPRKKVEKVWGRNDLPLEFGGETDRAFGEVWFEPDESSLGLLVKYLFTSEKLSVQVHPSDQQARRLGLGSRGKEECWLVMHAEPGAVLGLGLDQEYDRHSVCSAAQDGSIEGMLVWREVRPGDFFHVPPGTIHAIGAGVTILEIQQNTNITFRLFDYGRPRELHLHHALECARLEPYRATMRSGVGEKREEFVLDGEAFSVRAYSGLHAVSPIQQALLVPLAGDVRVNSETFSFGSCIALGLGDIVRSIVDAKFLIIQDNEMSTFDTEDEGFASRKARC